MNPYAADLGTTDPLEALTTTPRRVQALVESRGPAAYGEVLGPGKWSLEQVLVHLVHVELVFAARYRQALTQEEYVVQPFDQDRWMAREPTMYGADALEAWMALRAFNLPLLRSLTPAERERAFEHPELGRMTVWEYVQLHGGHDLHHLKQFERLLA